MNPIRRVCIVLFVLPAMSVRYGYSEAEYPLLRYEHSRFPLLTLPYPNRRTNRFPLLRRALLWSSYGVPDKHNSFAFSAAVYKCVKPIFGFYRVFLNLFHFNTSSVTGVDVTDVYGSKLVMAKIYDRAIKAINVSVDGVVSESELSSVTLEKDGAAVAADAVYNAETQSITVTPDDTLMQGTYQLGMV